MLRFLRKNLPNIRARHRFLGKIICLSAGMHAFGALIFVLGMRSTHVHRLLVRKDSLPINTRIVLVPFARHIVQKMPLASHAAPKKQQQLTSKKVETKKVTTLEKEKAVKPAPLPVKKVENKKEEKQIQKPVVQQSKERVEKKKDIKPEKQERSVKKELKVNAEAEPILYVGRDDLQELHFHALVAQVVQQEWQPPVGVPADAFCTVSFIIGSEGTALDIHLIESSRIITYDISARMAVARAKFARTMCGKQCQIVFKQ